MGELCTIQSSELQPGGIPPPSTASPVTVEGSWGMFEGVERPCRTSRCKLADPWSRFAMNFKKRVLQAWRTVLAECER